MLLRLLRCAETIGVRHILREPRDNPPAHRRAGRESRFAALGQRAEMSPEAGRYEETIRDRLEARGAADAQRQTGQ
jgi:hypothetical protein